MPRSNKDITDELVSENPQNIYMANPYIYAYPNIEKLDNGVLFPEIPDTKTKHYKPGD